VEERGGVRTASVMAKTFVELEILDRQVFLDLMTTLEDLQEVQRSLQRTWERRQRREARKGRNDGQVEGEPIDVAQGRRAPVELPAGNQPVSVNQLESALESTDIAA
jgi:hypothetical protein